MKPTRPSGFTLIEIIVAILLSAIAMAALLPMLDRVFLLSHEPRTTLQNGLDLQGAMDELVAWDWAHTNRPDLLHAYLPAAGGSFMDQIVVENRFIVLTNGLESPPAAHTNLLKVTLQNPLGETATRLFSVPP